MIKAVIFDCFGVLVGKGFWRVYESLGGDLSKDGDWVDEMLNQANAGLISRGDFGQAIADKVGVSYQDYQRIYDEDEQPDQEMFDFIKRELKPSYKIGLLSNAGRGSVERRIPDELMELFDAKIISADVGLLKPDPAIFELALEKLDVAPNEAVFIDDHAGYLPGAEAVGLKTILYKGFNDFKHQLQRLTGNA